MAKKQKFTGQDFLLCCKIQVFLSGCDFNLLDCFLFYSTCINNILLYIYCSSWFNYRRNVSFVCSIQYDAVWRLNTSHCRYGIKLLHSNRMYRIGTVPINYRYNYWWKQQRQTQLQLQ